VTHPDLATRIDLCRRKKTLQRREKFLRQVGFGNSRRITGSVNFFWIQIHFKNFTNPWKKTREFLAAQFVAISADNDVAILADVEMRVAKSPDVEALCVGF